MSILFDRVRRDGRIFGSVSLTRTIRSSILCVLGDGFLELRDFPYAVHRAGFTGIPSKEMWFVLALNNENIWKIVDYLSEENDKTVSLKYEPWE